MTSFLSTFVNKVDRKGRVSVPAPFRAALAGQGFQGIVAYPSLTDPAIDAIGRDLLDQMIGRRFDRTLEEGDFERVLLGGGGDRAVETVLAMVNELPFDGEGRIVLPKSLAESAGITDRAAFAGLGTRFQIWAPEAFERHQAAAIEGLRRRLADNGGSGTEGGR
jgi:MraZ protein